MSGRSADGVTVTPNADVWVIVPVHNESAVLGEVLAGLTAIFPHVVCVDDGSSDESVARIRAAGVHLVRHPVNLGQGAAIQTGVEYARAMAGASYFVTFDADGQHRPQDAQAMVERLRQEPADIILGTRFAAGGSSQVPPVRSGVLRSVVRLSPRLRRLGLTDAHNGLRAFTRSVADELELRSNRMGHASEFVALIEEHAWRVREQPVEVAYTSYSRRKGQPLLNAVNIVVEGFARDRRRR